MHINPIIYYKDLKKFKVQANTFVQKAFTLKVLGTFLPGKSQIQGQK